MQGTQTTTKRGPSFPITMDAPHRRCIVGGEPMIFHCHHYNTFLQRTITEDAAYIDSRPFLIGAAAEVAHAQLTELFQLTGTKDHDARVAMAQELYRWAGFGLFDLSPLEAEGGRTVSDSSHYAMAWQAKFGPAPVPVCYFASGWLAGATAAVFDRPIGAHNVRETTCAAVTGDEGGCFFKLSPGQPDWSVFESIGAGPLTDHQPCPAPTNNVDTEGIFTALSSMEIVGDDRGVIPAFGVYLTRMYANYYNRISFEFENALKEKFGPEGRDVTMPLLVEAGHVCAFNTFGGIMTSSEWDAMIRPSLKNKEDWVHGMAAAVNALGWGRWLVTSVSEREAKFVIHDDYESVGYLAMYGKADHPVSYLAEGAAAGIMDLVYLGDVASKPRFTPEFYKRLFRSKDSFRVECTASRATGDEVTSFRVFK